MISRSDLIKFSPRVDYSSHTKVSIESKDEFPHGVGCKIQEEPHDYKNPASQGPSQKAREVLDKALKSAGPDQIPVAVLNQRRGGYRLRYLRRRPS